MTIQSTGPVSFSDLQAEFGGVNPISISEYYRDADPALVTANNSGISNTGSATSVSDFRGSIKASTITVEFIGGGGGGAGYNNPGSATATSGGNSSISASSGVMFTTAGVSITSLSTTGGAGGSGTSGTNASEGGESSFYGSGGAGGINSDYGSDTDGQDAPATSYGAGGGSGGTNFDYPGPDGGHASTRVTHTLLAIPSSSITVTIGTGGTGGTGSFRSGGDGANGYAKFTLGNNVTELTASGTYTMPSS